MSPTQFPLSGFLQRQDFFSICLGLLSLYVVSLLASSVYNAFFGPLSSFPGPKTRALSIIPWARTTWSGKDNLDITTLHAQYGPVVRVAPNQLSFVGDAQVWKDIHGFRKHGQYEVEKDKLFYGQPLNKTPGIITADTATHSRQRKIVSHAFSDRALKEQEPMLKWWANKLRTKLTEQAARGDKSDMLKVSHIA